MAGADTGQNTCNDLCAGLPLRGSELKCPAKKAEVGSAGTCCPIDYRVVRAFEALAARAHGELRARYQSCM